MEEPVFTFWKLEKGRVFEFYTDSDVSYQKEDIISVWCERENNGLGNKIVYGKARIIKVPVKSTGLYKAIIVG